MNNRKIFEITMFWNERNIFTERIRNTLQYAEKIYIAEGNESHSGKIKRDFQLPTLLDQLPKELKSKVIFVPVDFSHDSETNPFEREKKTRDAALKELLKNPEFDDQSILLIQDFDEFIHPKNASELSRELFGFRFWRKIVRVKMRMTYYHLNLLDQAPWSLSLACKGSLARSASFSPNQWRHQFAKKKAPLSREYLGWHHSYLGDLEYIRNKIHSFAESEIEMVKKLTDTDIQKALQSGNDLFGRSFVYQWIDYQQLEPIPELVNRKDLFAKRTSID